MKSVISNLVERFENGNLSRRDLVQGLTMLFAAASVPMRSATAADTPAAASLTPTGIDHVSVLSTDKEHGIVRLGRKRVIVSIRKEKPYGTVDHFGVGVENFNKAAVTQVL